MAALLLDPAKGAADAGLAAGAATGIEGVVGCGDCCTFPYDEGCRATGEAPTGDSVDTVGAGGGFAFPLGRVPACVRGID